MSELHARLRAALPAAMKARDKPAVTALRSALAAIDNAGAVDIAAAAPGSLAIEQTALGAGAAELPRRELSEDQILALVRAEATDRTAAAHDYGAAGHAGRAAALLAEAAVLEALLAAKA